MDLGDFPLAGARPRGRRRARGLGPRRAALDKVLVDAAIEAGAELREGFAVDDLTVRRRPRRRHRGPAPTAAMRRGGPASSSAPTGANSRDREARRRAGVRGSADLQRAGTSPTGAASPATGSSCTQRGRRVIFAFPTNDDLFAIFVAWPIAELARVRARPGARAPGGPRPRAAARRARARRTARGALATARRSCRTSCASRRGPGWALVGDAGCHKDPYLGARRLRRVPRRRAARRRARRRSWPAALRRTKRSPTTNAAATRRRCPTTTRTSSRPSSSRCRRTWRRCARLCAGTRTSSTGSSSSGKACSRQSRAAPAHPRRGASRAGTTAARGDPRRLPRGACRSTRTGAGRCAACRPRRNDGDPDLARELLVDCRAEDDVRVVGRGGANHLGSFVHLDQPQVVAAGDREQDAARAGDLLVDQRRAQRALGCLARAVLVRTRSRCP